MLRLASAFAAALLIGAACAQNHDLGLGTTTGMGGGGGATTTTTTTTSATTSTSTTDTGPVEPSGPTALTVVDGINDYDAIQICFLPNQTPWPATAGGLAFGAAQAVDLASDLPAGTDATPWAIAGNLAATSGMTCDQILALAQPGDGGAPPVVAAPLGVISQVVLQSNRSLLLVPMGCMGGAGHDASGDMAGCGSSYSSQTPTTNVVFLGMSRITDPAHVALQVVSASVAFPTMDFRLLPNLSAAKEVVVAPSLSQGAIGPYPPFVGLALSDLGPLPGVQLRTYGSGQATPGSTVALSTVLSGSSVSAGDIVNGAGLVLVAVGSSPGTAAGSFWHPLTYALIQADPG